jgi:hypothetical protein
MRAAHTIYMILQRKVSGKRAANKAGSSRYSVPALERGLAIMQAFSGGRPRIRNSELVAYVGAPRNSVARLVRVLVEYGFLVDDTNGALTPGPAASRIAAAYVGGLPGLAHALPILQSLCERTGRATQLLVADGDEAVVVAQAVPSRPDPGCLASRVGARFALLARLPAPPSPRDGLTVVASAGLPVPAAVSYEHALRTAWILGPAGTARDAGNTGALPGYLSAQRIGIVAVSALPADRADSSLAVGLAFEPQDDVEWRSAIQAAAVAAQELEAASEPSSAER